MKSMTAFARSAFALNGSEYSLEIRSVNSRYREFSFRAPSPLRELEDRVRNVISQRIHRGRIQMNVSRDASSSQTVDVDVNLDLARKYNDALHQIKSEVGVQGEVNISVLSGLPELFSIRWPKADEEEIWRQFEQVLKDALDSFIEMRAGEGRFLKEDLVKRIKDIESFINQTEQLKDGVLETYALRLTERVKQLTNGMELDEQRLLMEIAVMAERSDITEELVRTRSHLELFNATLANKGPIGRKLEFIVQELNREINTISSKANNVEISQLMVNAKSELEKIREQIQNIE